MQQPIIVGLDPGITVGLAILDLKGNILSLTSRRDMQRSDVIKEIDEYGRPIIIACDVKPAPDSVEKIASTFGSKLFSPEDDLSVNEKVELTKGIKLKDDHQQDALASAIKAYRSYRKVIEKIEQTLERANQMDLFSEVVIRMLREGTENVSDVVNKILDERKKPVEEPVVIPKKVLSTQEFQNLVDKLQRKLSQKDSDLEIMKQHAESLTKQMESLQKEIKNLDQTKIVDKEIDRLWHRISILEKEVQTLDRTNEVLKGMRRIENEGNIPMLEIEKISYDEISELDKKMDLKGRVLFTNSTDNLNLLNGYEIRALVRITPLGEKELEKLEFPVISVSEDLIDKSDQIKFIKEDVFEREFKSARKSGLIGWLKRYRERKG